MNSTPYMPSIAICRGPLSRSGTIVAFTTNAAAAKPASIAPR